jgi:putative tricarboxylic transport membrane protein
MDGALAPFMKRNPIWPSTFPKVLSILGIVASTIILLGLEKSEHKIGDIDYRRLGDYKIGQALMLLALMVAYALLLRPAGFLFSTGGFLIAGSAILGERRWVLTIVIAAFATGIIWYLVQVVLGIYLRPVPGFIANLVGG